MQSADLLGQKRAVSSTPGRHHKDHLPTTARRHVLQGTGQRCAQKPAALRSRSYRRDLGCAGQENAAESRDGYPQHGRSGTLRFYLPRENVSRSNQFSIHGGCPPLKCSSKALLVRRVSYRNPFRAPDHGSWASFSNSAIRNREIEFRQVATVQVPGQIFRGEIDVLDLLHPPPVSVRRTRSNRSWHR